MGKIEETPADLALGTPQRNYKDTVFRMLYRDKSELLELYNAVNNTQYTDPEKLEAAGLENAIYMAMKNDVACIVDLTLDLYEHQSTVNPNMPLRDYAKYTDRVRNYSGKMAFQEAVEKAVSECIKEGILEEFLKINRAEVIQMSIFEYDEEMHMATLKKESWENGWQQGREDGWQQGQKAGAAWGNRLLAGMLERGLSPERISELTGEPVETIREAVPLSDHHDAL